MFPPEYAVASKYLSMKRLLREQIGHSYLQLTSTAYNVSLQNDFQPICFCHVNGFQR